MDLPERFIGELGVETDFDSVRNAIESIDVFFRLTEERCRGKGMPSIFIFFTRNTFVNMYG